MIKLKLKNWEYCLLILLLITAFSMRFHSLGAESIWLDEAYALRDAQQDSLNKVIVSAEEHVGTPPAYSILLHYWTKYFGDSEFALRLPSAILSALSIILIFLIAKELFNKNIAIISSIVMTLSMTHLVYAQEARAYALFTFFTLLSTLFYIKFLKNRTKTNATLYSIFTVSIIYTQYLGFTIPFLQNVIYFLIYYKYKKSKSFPKIKEWLYTQLAIIILYTPNLPVLINQIQNLQRVLPSHLSGLGIPSAISQLGIFLFAIPLIITLTIALILIYLRKSYNKKYDSLISKSKKLIKNQYLVFALIATILTLYSAFSPKLTTSTFITRYTHFLFPFAYILLVKAFTEIKRKHLQTILAVLFIAATIFALFSFYSQSPRKEQWREAADFIQQNTQQDGELILLADKDVIIPFEYYFKGNIKTIGLKTFTDKKLNEQILNEIKPSLKEYSGYWLILSHSKREQGVYKNYFDKNFNLVEEKHFKNINIYHYN